MGFVFLHLGVSSSYKPQIPYKFCKCLTKGATSLDLLLEGGEGWTSSSRHHLGEERRMLPELSDPQEYAVRPQTSQRQSRGGPGPAHSASCPAGSPLPFRGFRFISTLLLKGAHTGEPQEGTVWKWSISTHCFPFSILFPSFSDFLSLKGSDNFSANCRIFWAK